MTQQPTVEDLVIDVVRRARIYDVEEIPWHCSNLTWNQVFFAIDRLSRKGEIVLMPRGRGKYAVTWPQRQQGRPDRRSLPS